ncbi:MAG: CapA family protein [Ignavibacteriae bacterium]|nr:CapA family protein [Ignavibacteriota bacterium]
MKGYLKILLLFLLFTSFASCDKKELKENLKETVETILTDSVKSEDNDIITVIGVGDIMMGTTYPSSDLPPNDGRDIFNGVKNILEDADLTMGNLEGPFLNSGGTPKECLTPDRCYSFRVPERYGEYLKDAGFDYMSLANNHGFDMGIKGREATYRVLDDNEIGYSGTTDQPTTIIEVKGLKIGIAGFAPNRGTMNINNKELVEKTIKELKSECDLVYVFFHGGAEGAGAQNVPRRNEVFLEENRGDVYEFAHLVIDAGADVVFGSGPHVTRAVEIYKDRFIAYSLGNFSTYGKFSLAGPQGIAPIIKVFMKKNGEFIKAEVTSVKQVRRGFPVVDETEAVLKTIIRLTKTDFRDGNLEFEGNVLRKK